MQRRVLKLLEDVRLAGTDILEMTSGKSVEAYRADKTLRLAVERSFEIIGEALRRIRDEKPDQPPRISASAQIIGFRNVLAHGYDVIDNDVVWGHIQNDLPKLLAEVIALIGSA